MLESITLKNLYDAITLLFSFKSQLETAEDQRRQKLAKWLAELGLLIESVAMDLEHGQFPYTSCAKMSYMIDKFADTMDGIISKSDCVRIHDQLNHARNIEQLFTEFNLLDFDQKEDNIITLKQIAGTLQGAGSVLAIKS